MPEVRAAFPVLHPGRQKEPPRMHTFYLFSSVRASVRPGPRAIRRGAARALGGLICLGLAVSGCTTTEVPTAGTPGAGPIAEFPVPLTDGASSDPFGIVKGPDGN